MPFIKHRKGRGSRSKRDKIKLLLYNTGFNRDRPRNDKGMAMETVTKAIFQEGALTDLSEGSEMEEIGRIGHNTKVATHPKIGHNTKIETHPKIEDNTRIAICPKVKDSTKLAIR